MPAVIIPNQNRALASWDTFEHELNRYAFVRLASDAIEWKPSHSGFKLRSAIEGGRTRRGEALYFGRAMHQGRMCYGKVHPSHRCLFIGRNGAEIRYSNYEILTWKP